MSTSSQELRTRIATVRLDEELIYRVVIEPGAVESLADAQEAMLTYDRLRGGRRLPVLVDIREMKAQDREARQYYGSSEVSRRACAIALLVHSRVSTLIANFFLTVTRTSVPTRIFSDEQAATEWLKEHLR